MSRERGDKSRTGRKHLQKTHLTKDSHPKWTKNSYNSTVRKEMTRLKKTGALVQVPCFSRKLSCCKGSPVSRTTRRKGDLRWGTARTSSCCCTELSKAPWEWLSRHLQNAWGAHSAKHLTRLEARLLVPLGPPLLLAREWEGRGAFWG